MFKELDDYDWAEVFGEGHSMPVLAPMRHLTDTTTSQDTFGREDVELIEGKCEGQNDGPSWIIWGRLKDGRWFKAEGGCDYTGWDCQASNSSDVASTRDDIIRFGMTDDERDRFGLATVTP